MLAETVRSRLETQFEALFELLGGVEQDRLELRPESDKWSIRENIAHLGRYHEVFLQRMDRILNEDTPQLGRYSNEEDTEAEAWMILDYHVVLNKLKEQRAKLITFATGLSAEQLERTGVHPKLGQLSVSMWFEFFLLHEAHHLYRILWLSRM
ncbi:MAG: DinB family protein [Deinococcota bacterium]